MHSTIDPRVAVLFGLAEDGGLAGDGIRFARALEAAIRERIKPIPLNIDGALAAILSTWASRRWSASCCSSSAASPA